MKNILIYHSVSREKNKIYSHCVDEFDKKIKYLKRFFFLSKYREYLNTITFDDGYLDNFEEALPVLKKNQVSATFFIASGFLDGGWMWNDGIVEGILKTNKKFLNLESIGFSKYDLNNDIGKNKCICELLIKIKYLSTETRIDLAKYILDLANVPEPSHLMMTSAQIRKMHEQGMEIGGHTVNHPILSSVDVATARREIFENKEYLESIIGEKINSFAYPNGKPGIDYGPEHVKLVKEAGYKCAVTTAWGRVKEQSDPFQLPRFTPWDRNSIKFILRLWFQKFDENLVEV